MTITPNQARELLHETTPAPWDTTTHLQSENHASEIGPISIDPDAEEMYSSNPGDLNLAAAAPVMAEQIAGMQWEYAFQEKVPSGGPWTKILSTTTWTLDHCQDLLARMQSELPEKKYRLIRRLVSKPEEIS